MYDPIKLTITRTSLEWVKICPVTMEKRSFPRWIKERSIFFSVTWAIDLHSWTKPQLLRRFFPPRGTYEGVIHLASLFPFLALWHRSVQRYRAQSKAPQSLEKEHRGRVSREDEKRVSSHETCSQHEHVFKNFNCATREWVKWVSERSKLSKAKRCRASERFE